MPPRCSSRPVRRSRPPRDGCPMCPGLRRRPLRPPGPERPATEGAQTPLLAAELRRALLEKSVDSLGALGRAEHEAEDRLLERVGDAHIRVLTSLEEALGQGDGMRALAGDPFADT